MEEQEQEIRMLVDFDEAKGIVTASAKGMQDGCPLNTGRDQFDGLVVYAYIRDRDRSLYSWGWAYDGGYMVDLDQLEAQVKLGRKIDRFLERENGREGRPADFTQYAWRVCRAIGSAGFVIRVGPRRGHLYQDSTWVRLNAGELRVWLGRRLGDQAQSA